MAEQRPNPDALLARIEQQEEKRRRGKLKIFFGAVAGVGKTFAMLTEAQELKARGVDVVVGLVETHGRTETQALLAGLEVLPRQRIDYRGVNLNEFDLDAALRRASQLLLVDELAHTNAQGTRHPKRWLDIKELLDAGIDVYTTLNIQHLESLNDVVGKITGITVRETLPDQVLEQADEVELVDLPPDELLQRLQEGKVYLPQQAERAIQHFFRKGNLIALRELALRRTADRVDAEMRQYREDWAIHDVWQVRERLLVGITADTQAERIVRGARRLAQALQAQWIVVYVETPKLQRLPETERARILAILRLAESLGAETVTLAGHYQGEEILNYARAHNVTKIVLGKPATPAWRRGLTGSVVDYIVSHSTDIDVLFICGELSDAEFLSRGSQHAYFVGARQYLGLGEENAGLVRYRKLWWGVAVPLICTLIAYGLFPYFGLSNLIMLYLLGVVFVAHRYGRDPSITAAFLSVAAFDFFYVPPYLNFAVADAQYLLTFAVMLTVALIISGLTASVRLQAKVAGYRERRTAALYAMSRELAATRGVVNILNTGIKHLHAIFNSPAVILFPNNEGRIVYPRMKSIFGSLHGTDLAIAQWVYDHSEMAGFGTNTLPGSDTLYLPLIGAEGILGVLATLPTEARSTLLPEQQHLLKLFAGQIVLAIERARLSDTIHQAQLQMESERLRNALLSAISHDLRTPLAAIVGAADSLSGKAGRLTESTRVELLGTIQGEALRMSQLVNKVLEMAKLDAGMIDLKREWETLEELVGSALHELKEPLARHRVVTRLPAELPLICVDGLMIKRVLTNLLENAAKYTPAGSVIEISAEDTVASIVVAIADHGPGLKPGEEARLFEKFFQGSNELGGRSGVGLGLAIAQAIVTAHGGRIWAENRPEGGAVFQFSLPKPASPPPVTPLEAEESNLA